MIRFQFTFARNQNYIHKERLETGLTIFSLDLSTSFAQVFFFFLCLVSDKYSNNNAFEQILLWNTYK